MKRYMYPNVHTCMIYNSQAKVTIYNSQDNRSNLNIPISEVRERNIIDIAYM